MNMINPPQQLLPMIFWEFTEERFTDRSLFNEAVRQELLDSFHHRNPDPRKAVPYDIKKRDSWKPNAVVLKWPRIRIQCQIWQGNELKDLEFELVSDNRKNFTASELLFKIHNTLVNLIKNGGHGYFEGLRLANPQQPGQAPLYDMDVSS